MKYNFPNRRGSTSEWTSSVAAGEGQLLPIFMTMNLFFVPTVMITHFLLSQLRPNYTSKYNQHYIYYSNIWFINLVLVSQSTVGILTETAASPVLTFLPLRGFQGMIFKVSHFPKTWNALRSELRERERERVFINIIFNWNSVWDGWDIWHSLDCRPALPTTSCTQHSSSPAAFPTGGLEGLEGLEGLTKTIMMAEFLVHWRRADWVKQSLRQITRLSQVSH